MDRMGPHDFGQENAGVIRSTPSGGARHVPACEQPRSPLLAIEDARRADTTASYSTSAQARPTINTAQSVHLRRAGHGDALSSQPLGKLARQLQVQARRVDGAVQHAKVKAEHLARPQRNTKRAVDAEAALQAAAERLISAKQAALRAAACLAEEVRRSRYPVCILERLLTVPCALYRRFTEQEPTDLQGGKHMVQLIVLYAAVALRCAQRDPLQEEVLSKDVAAVEEKLRSAAWVVERPTRQAGGVHRGSRGSASIAGDESGTIPEVRAYDDFVARHGATGGWHPDDAATFAQAVR